MSLRECVVTGRAVLLAEKRRGLPIDPGLRAAREAQRALANASQGACPFCPGRESETEATLQAAVDAQGRWLARSVHNRYPSVHADAPEPAPREDGEARANRGDHEVLVESREHDADWATFDPAHAARVLTLWRDRVRALGADPRWQTVALFRNKGARAGSTQRHPHAQVVALALEAPGPAHRARLARSFFERTGRELLSHELERGLAQGERHVFTEEGVTALCPFAPHRSGECWLLSPAASPCFAELEDAEVAALGRALASLAARTVKVLGDVDYNVLLRQPPVRAWREPWARFYLELAPRLGGDAGFELGTEVDVLTRAPEDHAAALRAAV